MLPKRSFKPAKCKTALNLAKSRLKLMKNKKDIQLKQLRREVAQLLESGQDQTARIRVEHVVREEKMIDAYEMIQIYCELVVARLPIIESQKNCPLDLKEAIGSLIFAAPRCGDIDELQDVRKHFTAKYGKEFVTAAAELRPECGVSRTLIEKLSVKAPDGPTKVKILTAIAEEHNIKWEPNWFKDEEPMPSVDIPNVAAIHTMESSKIQMQPLHFEIADDLEEKHARDKVRRGSSSQSHAHSNDDLVPPSSTSHPDSRRSESSSEKMVFNQPTETSKNSSTTGRQNWNMEFKDATEAAQAAAESAERANLAARAAAQFSRLSNAMDDSSSGPGLPFVHGQNDDSRHDAGSGLQHNQVHRNSTSDPVNQRNPGMQNRGNVSRQSNMTGEDEATGLNETEKKDNIESKNSRRQTTDFDSGPSTSGAEPSISRPSYFQEYEDEPSENPFHEETLESKNQSSIFQSQSSIYEDEFGVYANSEYDDYKHDSGDDSFGTFSRQSADKDEWHVRSANTYGDEGMRFQDFRAAISALDSDKKYEFDSHNDIFVGMDHKIGKDIDDKRIDTNAEVTFDESDSDDNDVYAMNPAEEHNLSSPAEPASKGFSPEQDIRHYDRDLSESFKQSPLFSKLTEPLSVTFDDSDSDSDDEKELERRKSDLRFSSYDYEKPDADPHLENKRSSYVENENENENRYYGSVSTQKSVDGTDASQSPYSRSNSVAMSTDFESQSMLDGGGSKRSLQSLRSSESRRPASEVEYETQSRPESGMELNLGSLLGGRRNKPQLRTPSGGFADASSPSKSTDVAPSDSFGSTEKASTYGYHVRSNRRNDEHISTKMSGVHAHFDSPDDDIEAEITRKGSTKAGGCYRPSINENLSKISLKDATGYFVQDESSSEEDAPKPVTSKSFVSAGLSRRTKGSAPRSVARSEASAAASNTVPPSSSYTKVTSSRTVNQSSRDDEASNYDKSLNSPVAKKPTTPKSQNVPEASNSNDKAARENFTKKPSHVHPKLPDFETVAATLHSLRKNRQ